MAAFLQNALGFLMQFFPCVLLIFIPFSQEVYRFRRRSVFIWMTIASAAMAAGFSAILCLRDMEKYPRHVVISDPLMMLAIILILSAYIWLIKESVMKKLLVFFIVIFYAVTVFIIVNITYAFLFPDQVDTTIYPYTVRFLVLYSAVTAVLLPLLLVIVIRPLKEYIQIIETRNMRREFFIVTFFTVFYFVMTVYYAIVTGKAGLFYYFIAPMIFMTLDQILIYWLIFRESVRRRIDSEQRRAMEIQQLQYEKIVGDMENTRRMRHDMRHHYNSLNDMLDREQFDEMKDYLSKLIDTTVKRDNEVYCKNMTVNGLLQYYIGIARDEDIKCEVSAECDDLAIEPSDLTVLFGNAMENAIKACSKCPDNRLISIRVGTVQDSFAIEISNSCTEVQINRHFYSEEKFLPAEAFLDDTGRKYGLRSIAQTAQKYGGSAKFCFDKEKMTFTVRIRLNMHTGA